MALICRLVLSGMNSHNTVVVSMCVESLLPLVLSLVLKEKTVQRFPYFVLFASIKFPKKDSSLKIPCRLKIVVALFKLHSVKQRQLRAGQHGPYLKGGLAKRRTMGLFGLVSLSNDPRENNGNLDFHNVLFK